MVKAGIIGCGKIAQVRHIPEYHANPNALIIGYYDFNLQRAQEMAKKFGGKAYNSLEELLKDSQIDAVSVCVANNAHAEVTVRALSAGKHVLCEKPMATNIEDCERMVAAAKKNGKLLMIGQNQRLMKAHRRAKDLIEEGVIGKVLTFRSTFGHRGPETWSVDKGPDSWFFDKNRAGMGAMADLGVHKTDLIQYLINAKVVRTTAVVRTLDKKDSEGSLIGVDDNALCIFEMDNGVIGTVTASWTYYGANDNSTSIYGTGGIMKISGNPLDPIEIIKKDGSRLLYDPGQIQKNNDQIVSGVIDAFVASIISGEEPAVSGESVLSAMKVVFASIQSSQLHKTIEII